VPGVDHISMEVCRETEIGDEDEKESSSSSSSSSSLLIFVNETVIHNRIAACRGYTAGICSDDTNKQDMLERVSR